MHRKDLLRSAFSNKFLFLKNISSYFCDENILLKANLYTNQIVLGPNYIYIYIIFESLNLQIVLTSPLNK